MTQHVCEPNLQTQNRLAMRGNCTTVSHFLLGVMSVPSRSRCGLIGGLSANQFGSYLQWVSSPSCAYGVSKVFTGKKKLLEQCHSPWLWLRPGWWTKYQWELRQEIPLLSWISLMKCVLKQHGGEHTHSHMHSLSLSLTHIHTHARTHTRTHTHTHACTRKTKTLPYHSQLCTVKKNKRNKSKPHLCTSAVHS